MNWVVVVVLFVVATGPVAVDTMVVGFGTIFRTVNCFGYWMPSSCRLDSLYFQHFYFEHDLGLGEILRGDQLFRHADGLGRIAHHQQIELFIYEYGVCAYHRFDHGLRLFGIRIAQIETSTTAIGIPWLSPGCSDK